MNSPHLTHTLLAWFRKTVGTRLGASIFVIVLAVCATLPASFGFHQSTLAGALALTASAVFWFICIPLTIIHFVRTESLETYAWQLPRLGISSLWYTVLVLAIHLGAIVVLASFEALNEHYDIYAPALTISILALATIYYIAEEFLFRGFLLGLTKRYGVLWMYGINVVVFALLHTPKPTPAVLVSAVSSVLLCWLTLRTASFIPAALVHSVSAFALLALLT